MTGNQKLRGVNENSYRINKKKLVGLFIFLYCFSCLRKRNSIILYITFAQNRW